MSAAKERIADVNETFAGVCRSQLTDQCIKYLSGRGMTGESIDKWEIGFAGTEWGWTLKATGDSEERLFEAGLLGRNERGGFYDRFKSRLIFPIRRDGLVVGFGARQVQWYPQPGGKYTNSPETPLFVKSQTMYGEDYAIEAARSVGRMIVCEGFTDTILMHQCGITNVVACMGVAVSESHLEKLSGLEIVLLLDGDEVGQKRSRSLAAMLIEAGANDFSRIAALSTDDPAALLQRGDKQLIVDAVEDSTDPLRCLLGGVIRRINVDDVSSQMELLREMYSYIRSTTGRTRQTITGQVARAFGLSVKAVSESFSRFEKEFKRG